MLSTRHPVRVGIAAAALLLAGCAHGGGEKAATAPSAAPLQLMSSPL